MYSNVDIYPIPPCPPSLTGGRYHRRPRQYEHSPRTPGVQVTIDKH